MIGELLDNFIAVFDPAKGVQRANARRIGRAYAGAQPNPLSAHIKPTNSSANSEQAAPYGADASRAWARKLVRDNSYAFGVVDTIVASVIGNGMLAESMVEDAMGNDEEDINEARDRIWDRWSEVADINGDLSFEEIQALAQREMVEAGECLVHYVTVPLEHNGITRPVPLAIELIEADRLASDLDTRMSRKADGAVIVRGIEVDALGKPIAYHVYPQHPNDFTYRQQTPVRLPAHDVRHLFRKDRIGQSRGITWFAPVMGWIRDLGLYVDNELQASAVASCFTVAVKTETPIGSLSGAAPSVDAQESNQSGAIDYLQPGQIMYLNPNESIESANPGRPNSAAGPWIDLMLRGIAVGTGLSFETVARDFSKTNYSSNRASQLEDRRRFRMWQRYMKAHLCLPTWDRFCQAAAMAGRSEFPTTTELLAGGRPSVEFQAAGWEWVDPVKEQMASASAIDALQTTYQEEMGKKGRNWRRIFRQRAKEEALKTELALESFTPSNKYQTNEMIQNEPEDETTPAAEVEA